MPEPENSLPKGFWAKQIISINPAELNVIAFVSMMDEMHIVLPRSLWDWMFWF